MAEILAKICIVIFDALVSHGGIETRGPRIFIFGQERTARKLFRPAHGGADFGQHTAAQILAKISAITWRRRLSFMSRFVFRFRFRLVFILFSDFGNNFGHHTTAQILAKFRPAHGGTDFAPKFFRDRYGRKGFYDQKVLFFIKSTSY